ncbi:sulfurtransferase [Elysia marginata]|uniref:Sulfurtransferase n=1 Tax=Elysia marginata TaxID=1093978 RepID=A0AAV4GGB2_9GAST|nr:sulfurtransferase [Elysia marginata]
MIASKPGNHRILDASWHLPNTGRDAKTEYAESHIPGALFFDIEECVDKTTFVPHQIPSSDGFATYVSTLGINNETHITVYDNNPKFGFFSGQRVWWMFRLFGHNPTKISLLEGGLPKWVSEGGEVTSKVTDDIQTQTYKASFDPTLVKNYEDIEKNVSSSEFTLVDARPSGRFQGVAPEPRDDTKPGCIPNSKNIPFYAVLNDDRTMKSPEELKAIFQEEGIDINKPFVCSCGTGISACVLALAAHLCGNDNVAIYDGAWTEWYHRAPAKLKLNVPED